MIKMKWLGLINLYFLLCAAGIVVFLIAKKEVIQSNKITKSEPTYVKVAYPELEQVRGEVREGFDVAKLLTSDEAKINRGRELFASNCTSCHGKEGKGDGAALIPAPRNFHSLEGWTNGPQKSMIFKTLTEGVPGTGMAPWGTLPVEDRVALIEFIHTLRDDYPLETAADIAFLEKEYGLNQSKKTQSQVPIKVAISSIIGEKEDVSAKIEAADIASWSSKPEATYQLLAKSTAWQSSPAKLLKFLSYYENIVSISTLKTKSNEEIKSIYEKLLLVLAPVAPVAPVAPEVAVAQESPINE